MVAGPIVSVVILSLIGVAWSPVVLGAVLVVGGLGGAAFHPASAAFVNRLGGRRRGLAMSIHITGGSLGYSLAPVLFAPFVDAFGLSWTPVLALPGLALLTAVLARAPHPRSFGSGSGGGLAILRPYAKPLTLLYLIVVVRTMTSLSLATFVPVLLTRQGWSVGMAGAAVSIYLFAASMGGFTGGPLADRFGPKRVIAASMLLAVPLLVVGDPPERLAARHHADRRRLLPAVHAARERDVRAPDRPGERRNGVIPDDGIRVGHRRPHRPARRLDGGPVRHRAAP